MATGSHIKARNKTQADQPYAITYDGKEEEGAILKGPRLSLVARAGFGDGAHDNRLIFGDNLPALRTLMADPGVRGKVELVYIDPPFATGFGFQSAQVGHAYSDALGGAAYLEHIRQRLVLLRELMADNGTIYLHIDVNMLFPVEIVMGEVFGTKNFRSLITRVKCNPKNQARRKFGDVCDYIIVYTKTADYVWNHPVEAWVNGDGELEYHCVEEGTGRHYKKVPCHLPGIRNGATGSTWRGRLPPPGKHWVHSPAKLDELDRQGRIYWSANGNPRRKLYLDESPGIYRSNLWPDFRDTQNQNARVTGYPTEKNNEMMKLIVEASSSPGSLVLDCYSGSGTTLMAAGVLGRRWIGIDNSPTAISVAVTRLTRGTPRMGSYARRSYISRDDDATPLDSDLAFRLFAPPGVPLPDLDQPSVAISEAAS